jgi:hypothetical protein
MSFPMAVDPLVGTALTGGVTDITGFITGNLLPIAVGLTVLGIAIRLGFKIVAKFSKKVG